MLDVVLIEPQNELAPILGQVPELRVTRASPDADALDGKLRQCDLVLVSAQLPAAQVMHYLEQLAPAQRVVIVSASEARDEVLPYLEAGAAGYVPQNARPSEMISILNAIHEGKAPLAPEIGTALVERMHELLVLEKTQGDTPRELNLEGLEMLTRREREILGLIRNGASNQLIANELTIELGTVKNHVHNILKKLKVSRREEAALYLDIQKTPS
jgi:DNA-binding NarL/FixJ family response regulator